MKAVHFSTLCLAIAVSSPVSFGKTGTRVWGPNGHRITAEIGERHLTPQAKERVQAIAGGHDFAYLATWPDDVRSDKNWNFMKKLHFVSVDDTDTLEHVLSRTANNDFPSNVVEAIGFFRSILEGDTEKKEIFEKEIRANKASLNGLSSSEEVALAYLIHFSGDVHQPLHVGRTYDLGGNKIKVELFGENTNLHSVWDEGMLDKQMLSYTEYATLLDHPTLPEVAAWQDAPVNEWAQESIDLRLDIYKQTYAKTDFDTGIPTLDFDYVFKMKPVMEQRLLKGGIRLAGLVNEIYR